MMATLAAVAIAATATQGMGAVAAAVTSAALTSVGSMIDSLWLQPLFYKPTTSIGPRLDSVRIQTAAEGEPIAYAHGPLNRIAGNVIWASDELEERKSTSKSGGKGGGSSSTSYTYFTDVSIALCEAPTSAGISAIKKIYANGKLFYDAESPSQGDNRYDSLTFHLGASAQSPSSLQEESLGIGNVPGYAGIAYIDIGGLALADFGNTLPQFNFVIKVDDVITVKSLIERLCARAGLSEDQYSVSDSLVEEVTGLVIEGPTPMKDALEYIMLVYGVSAKESNGQLVFFSRNEVTTREIAGRYVGAQSWSMEKTIKGITVEERDESQLPYAVALQYWDTTNEAQAGSLQQTNQTTSNFGIASINLPMTLTPIQAKNVAANHLWRTWSENRLLKVNLPPRFIDIEEGDVCLTDHQSVAYTYRVTQTTRGYNGLHEIEAVLLSTAAGSSAPLWGSGVTGVDNANVPAATPYTPPDITWFLIDVPPLIEEEWNTAGAYLVQRVATGTTFLSSTLNVSGTEDGEYSALNSATRLTTSGETLSSLSTGREEYFTTNDYLDIQLNYGSILSLAEEYVINGENHILVGSEIIAFKVAELIGAGQYRLSGLLRGRRGTANQLHDIGENVVALSDESLTYVKLNSAYIGTTKFYKLPALGQGVDDVAATAFNFNSVSQKPFSPATVRGSRDVSGNLDITWKRRTRRPYRTFGPSLVPQDDASYRVEVMDGSSVIRTINALSETASYTAAEQTTDFGSAQSSLTVRVYQVSATMGIGSYIEEVI